MYMYSYMQSYSPISLQEILHESLMGGYMGILRPQMPYMYMYIQTYVATYNIVIFQIPNAGGYLYMYTCSCAGTYIYCDVLLPASFVPIFS